MYGCLAYDYNNKLLTVPATFETEESAWKCIQEIMQQENHPKMMWVVKGVEPLNGYADSDGNSCR